MKHMHDRDPLRDLKSGAGMHCMPLSGNSRLQVASEELALGIRVVCGLPLQTGSVLP